MIDRWCNGNPRALSRLLKYMVQEFKAAGKSLRKFQECTAIVLFKRLGDIFEAMPTAKIQPNVIIRPSVLVRGMDNGKKN